MTIEVRQLVITSNIRQDVDRDVGIREPAVDTEEMTERILAECRQLVTELTREQQER